MPGLPGRSLPDSLDKVAGLGTYIKMRPPLHFAVFEFPVVVDLEKKRVSYYEYTARFGRLLYPDMRNVVSKYIESIIQDP